MKPEYESPTTQAPIEDPHPLGVAEYLIKNKNLHITITYAPNWSGRVQGVLEGPANEIREIFMFLEQNQPIGCRDLIEAIKHVRTKIFQTKQLHASQRGPQ